MGMTSDELIAPGGAKKHSQGSHPIVGLNVPEKVIVSSE